MSVHVYLKSGQQEKQEGRRIHEEKSTGRFYLFLNEITDYIPEKLIVQIEEVTLHDYFELDTYHEIGHYQIDGAQAFLEVTWCSGRECYQIKISAKTIEGALKIYNDIRGRKIRPKTSYGSCLLIDALRKKLKAAKGCLQRFWKLLHKKTD